MFSNLVKSALEREVVGQPRAINNIVRGVTRLVSGLTPHERSLCAYLFMGPTGTGKTHLVRALARFLNRQQYRAVVADCAHPAHGDPWASVVAQLMPLFSGQQTNERTGIVEAPPLSIIQIEHLERGAKEVAGALASALETAQLSLPDGRHGSLQGTLVIVTSALCAPEILDEAPVIGFTGSLEENEEEDQIYEPCFEKAVEHFGSDLLGWLDGFVIFHKLEAQHLEEILDRRIERLNHWLAAGHGVRCELEPAGRAFLLERGTKDLRLGARDLVRAHQKFVEFPVADLLVSGRIPHGGVVAIDRKARQDHLHFTVEEPVGATRGSVHEIPVG